MTWEAKVHRVIGKLASASFEQANRKPNGERYRKHRPYSLPAEASDLVACLGMRDRAAAEIRAKEIMMELRLSRVEIDDVAGAKVIG